MQAYIIDNNSIHLRELASLLNTDKIISVAEANQVTYSPGSVIFLSGSHSKSVNSNTEYFAPELELINTSPLPIIGICLGFELLCAAAGSRVVRLQRPEQGLITIYPTDDGKKWFDGPLTVLEAHKWGVRDCPPAYKVLARSDECIEAIINHNRIGLQFHPESLTKKDGAYLLFKLMMGLSSGPLPN